MKHTLIMIVLGVIVALGCYSFHNVENYSMDRINAAIASGQTDLLSEYLAPDVDFNLHNSQTRCSKREVTQVLGQFFRQNKPQGFICDNNRSYISGSLTTADGKTYKVSYTLKTINRQEVITGLFVY